MGLDWQEGPMWRWLRPYEQSKRADFYKGMLKKLFEGGVSIHAQKQEKKLIRWFARFFGLEFLYPESFRSLDADDSNQDFRLI